MCRQPLQHARIYTHALIVAPPTEGVPDSEDVSDHVDGDAGSTSDVEDGGTDTRT